MTDTDTTTVPVPPTRRHELGHEVCVECGLHRCYGHEEAYGPSCDHAPKVVEREPYDDSDIDDWRQWGCL